MKKKLHAGMLAISLIICALVHPLMFLITAKLASVFGLFDYLETNTYGLRESSLPLYTAIAVVVFIVYTTGAFQLYRRRMSFAHFLKGWLLSNLVYIGFGLFLLVACSGIEGNVVGFILAPIFLFMALICTPLSIVIFMKLIKRAERQPAVRYAGVVQWVVAGAVVIGLVNAWCELPFISPELSLLEHRSDTPQFAVQQVRRAFDTRDLALLQRYADIDAIVEQFGVQGYQIGSHKADIIAALTGSDKAPELEGRILLLQRWVLGSSSTGRLGAVSTKRGQVYAYIPVLDVKTGQESGLSFVMKRTDLRYRLEPLADRTVTAIADQQRYDSQAVAKANAAALAAAQDLGVQINAISCDIPAAALDADLPVLLSMAAAQPRVPFRATVSVTNKTAKNIATVRLMGYIQGHGSVYYTEAFQFTPLLEPGATRTITVEYQYMNYLMARTFLKDRLEFVAVPQIAVFDGASPVFYDNSR